MATFIVLTGKALASKIKGYGKTAATFTEATHQLAYSALNHVEVHSCASHLNNLYSATPINYRGAIRVWATALGKVKFTATPEEAGQFFMFDKASKSDLPQALEVSPAAFVKDKAGAKEKAFDELKALETFTGKMLEQGASKATIDALQGLIRTMRAPADAAKEAVKAAKLDKALDAKAAPKAPAKPKLVPATVAPVEAEKIAA